MSETAQDPAAEPPAEPAAEPAAEPPADEASADGASAEPSPACALCTQPIPAGPPRYVNQQQVCAACEAQVLAELAAQRASARVYPMAALAGLAGALIGGGVWAAIVIITELEVGYVAVLVGFLAGFGVKLGARGKRGVGLQALAAGLSVVGLLAAKYFAFASLVVKMVHEQGGDISPFDSRILEVFPSALREMVTGFDVLWVILAVGAAYRIPAPLKVHVNGG